MCRVPRFQAPHGAVSDSAGQRGSQVDDEVRAVLARLMSAGERADQVRKSFQTF